VREPKHATWRTIYYNGTVETLTEGGVIHPIFVDGSHAVGKNGMHFIFRTVSEEGKKGGGRLRNQNSLFGNREGVLSEIQNSLNAAGVRGSLEHTSSTYLGSDGEGRKGTKMTERVGVMHSRGGWRGSSEGGQSRITSSELHNNSGKNFTELLGRRETAKGASLFFKKGVRNFSALFDLLPGTPDLRGKRGNSRKGRLSTVAAKKKREGGESGHRREANRLSRTNQGVQTSTLGYLSEKKGGGERRGRKQPCIVLGK